ncbi:ATM_1a_G0035080.mRNA.1.CDS.1 [Saccharomyces cerevisiae]|nr:ATM_1a_G0035080.mRNA.1.CDS.1 [Saccharomyces cerevisiae]CAI7221256.1 ATM_1a_G0035080.mRNA.1.CDS.1 [Saccharomyces cerevisiae]
MNLIHKLQFLSYITCGHEKSDETNWSQIAKRTNTYMFEQKIWNSPILFSDGIDCEKFLNGISVPLYLRKRLCQLVPLILNSGHI